MELRNEAFHLLRQLFQQHTARWQQALPDLTKPQYAVMRSVAEHPGIEQVALIEAAVSTKVRWRRCSAEWKRAAWCAGSTIRPINAAVLVYLTDEGEALLNRSIPQGNEVDDEFLGRLSDDEREQFSRLVHKMMAP
ncbi:marR family transcriptional regulator [Klebsiella pneumoniae]|uniref:MarR family transcriptional regulator n=1 Tax=Klebsiella pneumoniae TaxID=573 RepID=A0A378AB68_KLEPN|nr:marR family transcriptional regulator [Klebsiella pneumoniae]